MLFSSCKYYLEFIQSPFHLSAIIFNAVYKFIYLTQFFLYHFFHIIFFTPDFFFQIPFLFSFSSFLDCVEPYLHFYYKKIWHLEVSSRLALQECIQFGSVPVSCALLCLQLRFPFLKPPIYSSLPDRVTC